jgi:ATP-binding cassette, subfamily C, bacterial
MKYSIVQQHSEEDCGAACLATICLHYGRKLSISRVREAIGTGQLGTNLLGLKRGADRLGFIVRSGKAKSLDSLDRIPKPAIIHWKGYHWVVLYGKKRKKYVVADPGVGLRYITPRELSEAWNNGAMLLLTPDELRFYQQPEEKIGGISRFFRRVLHYRRLLIQIILLNLVISLLALAMPFLLQILTDNVLVRGDLQLLTTVVIGVMVMTLFSSFLRFIQSNLIAHFAQRLELGLVLEFGRQILRLPLSYYESRRSGEIVSRLQDIREINQLISQVVIGFPSQFFIAVVSFCLMLFYSWKLTSLAIVVAGLMSLAPLLFLSSLQQKTRTMLVTAAENQGMLVETFKGALTLKTTNAKTQAWEEFQTRFGHLANVTFGTIEISILNNVFSGLVSGLGGVAILGFGSTLVIGKVLTLGQLLAFKAMNDNFTAFISSVINFVDEFARTKTAIERLTEVIDTTPEDEEDNKKAWVNIPDSADIICTQLNFHHTGRIDMLKDFNVTIPGGRVTALIGQSGCGKSTLAKLIAGLYQVRSGNISYGIYNQQDLALENLNQQIVLVPQEPHFWSRSILENFLFSYPDASFEEIVTACQITCADEFIKELPDKYQTVLGEFGTNLSGGQKQRLALARAMVNNPTVLILDESTSALDPILEAKVLDRLLFDRRGKTTIIISHRPRVIMRADWLIFLNKGQLQMQGNPQELQQLEGEHLQFLIP